MPCDAESPAAFRAPQVSERRDIKTIVLLGGRGSFSNGIHLNVIQAAKDPSRESWNNINAINEVVQAIRMPRHKQIMISALQVGCEGSASFHLKNSQRKCLTLEVNTKHLPCPAAAVKRRCWRLHDGAWRAPGVGPEGRRHQPSLHPHGAVRQVRQPPTAEPFNIRHLGLYG